MLDSAVFAAVSGMSLFANNRAEYIQNERVSANYFHVLGIRPLLGREFSRAEDVRGGPGLAVISFALWQRVFNGNPAILGRTVEWRGEPYTIVGVMPGGFLPVSHTLDDGEAHVDVWTPLHPATTGEGNADNYEVIGRLR